MSRFEINSWVRKKTKRMSRGESLSEISFWVRKPKFIDKCRIIFSTILRCFVANPKTKCLRPVSNVVLLPCRTQLIELNSTLAQQ